MTVKGTLVYGVGINDADYPVNKTTGSFGKRITTWRCPYYQRWVNMLERVYDGDREAYRGVTVCEEWLIFTNFKGWMQTQDWSGKELDKDLLGGNLYSPETCVFLDKKLNMLLIKGGVSQDPVSKKWYGSVRTPAKRVKTKRYSCSTLARLSVLKLKLAVVESLTDEVCPTNLKPLVKTCLQKRVMYKEKT